MGRKNIWQNQIYILGSFHIAEVFLSLAAYLSDATLIKFKF